MDAYPNVEPVSVPSVSSMAVALAAQSFSSVYCLSLPALIPWFNIFKVIEKIAEGLVPGGLLHLIIIDPLPLSSTIGDYTRDWLEEYLVMNTDEKWLCKTPNTQITRWLRNAGLLADGSVVRKARFMAVTDEQELPADERPGLDQNGERKEDRVLTALQDTVGRMLWRDVWGRHLTGGKFWWEDPLCVQECVERKTTFEYTIIDAVRAA